ncbi:MAG: hypothetical protein ACJ790_13940 [Myxococcaceae bacterium]
MIEIGLAELTGVTNDAIVDAAKQHRMAAGDEAVGGERDVTRPAAEEAVLAFNLIHGAALARLTPT